MKRAIINKILPYSVVDGPGNRAVIFFQQCNLQCVYCHNPETQRLCMNCGECITVCPENALRSVNGKVVWDQEKCRNCDACIQHCQNFSSPKVMVLTPEQVISRVKQSKPFIRGLTTSGGECSLYAEFLQELFILAKAEGLSCLMDCNGMVRLSDFPFLMEVCDGVMLDVKAWDPIVHKKLTGKENKNVKETLLYLAEIKKLTEVRVVILPGIVDAFAVINGIVEMLGKNQIKDLNLKLIRFRSFGVRGRFVDFPAPSIEVMRRLEQHAREKGFEQVTIV